MALGLPAAAAERVRFAGASGEAVQGEMSLPKGDGPFPAVVLLHSCLGLPANRGQIAGALASWGYAALFVDDFATRGLKETCAVEFPQVVGDAFGALAFLAGRSEVDSARVAAIGFSQGGDAALRIAASPAGSGGLGFAAAAAFYPPCDNEADATLRIPTLIMVGASDSVTPAADCARLAVRQPGMTKLVVYPGASHGFDDPEFGAGKRILGMNLAYDRGAAAKSWPELRAFLKRTLGR